MHQCVKIFLHELRFNTDQRNSYECSFNCSATVNICSKSLESHCVFFNHKSFTASRRTSLKWKLAWSVWAAHSCQGQNKLELWYSGNVLHDDAGKWWKAQNINAMLFLDYFASLRHLSRTKKSMGKHPKSIWAPL